MGNSGALSNFDSIKLVIVEQLGQVFPQLHDSKWMNDGGTSNKK